MYGESSVKNGNNGKHVQATINDVWGVEEITPGGIAMAAIYVCFLFSLIIIFPYTPY